MFNVEYTYMSIIKNKHSENGFEIKNSELPPEEISEAIRKAIKKNLFILDGRVGKWHKDSDEKFRFEICSGFPEYPEPDGSFSPSYKTREKFTGMDNSEGLSDYLPKNWDYELDRNSVFVIYKK
jgi:hypothetical protein